MVNPAGREGLSLTGGVGTSNDQRWWWCEGFLRWCEGWWGLGSDAPMMMMMMMMKKEEDEKEEDEGKYVWWGGGSIVDSWWLCSLKDGRVGCVV